MQFLEDLYAIVVFAWMLPLIPINRLLHQKHAKLVVFLFVYGIMARALVLTIGPSIPPQIAFSGLCARLLFMPAAYLFIRNQLKFPTVGKFNFIHVLPVAFFSIFCFSCYLSKQPFNFLATSYLNHFATKSADLNIPVFSIWLGVYWVSGIYLWLVLEMLLEQFKLRQVNYKPVAHQIPNRCLPETGSKSYALNSIFTTETQLQEYDKRIQHSLSEKQLFLQPRFSLQQFAEDLKIPMHQLSAFINSYYKVNFNDLINVRRIHHSITLIERGETEFKTLEAISFESGFKNRNTFTAAFKKVTGMSPSAYLKRRKPGIESKQHPTFSSNWEDTILKPNVFTAT